VRNWARYGADWAAARGDDHEQIRLAVRRFLGMMPPIAPRCRSPLTGSKNCTAAAARSRRLVFDAQQHDQNAGQQHRDGRPIKQTCRAELVGQQHADQERASDAA